MMELTQLQLRHAQEQHSKAKEQQQAQEQLQQHQQQEFQEQQNTFFRLQQEQLHQPTIQREHEILMLQQACVLAEKMYLQQQQHLLHTQQQERERMHERHWHEEQLLIQQLQHMEQQQQQQQQHHQHNGIQQYQPQQSPQFQQVQHHQGQSPHQQQTPSFSHSSQSGYRDSTQQAVPLSNTQHQQQQYSPQHTPPGVHNQQQQQQHQPHQNHYYHSSQTPEGNNPEDAMDVDDEVQINSITSTISSLRHSMPVDIDSVSSWASGSGDNGSRDDGDPHAVVVLDTNVLISHLNFIQSLIDAHGTSLSDTKKGSSRPGSPQEPHIIFIVPWVVVRELDGLKGNRNHGGGGEVDLGEKARRAIRYIHEEMEKPADKRKLRGQKISECMEKQDQNDDYILDCCRYFKAAYPDEQRTRVNLFSNDRNLCVKALIHEIKTISRDKVSLEVKTVLAAILGQQKKEQPPRAAMDMMTLDDNDDEDMMGSKPSPPATKPSLSRSSSSGVSIISGSSRGTYRTEVNERELQRIKSGPKTAEAPQGMDPGLFNLTSHVIKNLRQYFEFAVPDHLQAMYGSDWKLMTDYDRTVVKGEDLAYDCKRLAQPIQLVLRNWAIFADLYGGSDRASKAKNHLNQLQMFVKTWDRVETFGLGKVYKKDLVAFLNDVDAVLAGLMTKPAKSIRSSSQPMSSSAKETDTAKYYDASSRIQLMKNWKAHCSALAD
ncbi:hypothetical protein EMPS_04569 [Entomortierella parvispora]|uniref:PIN domain-containing protein n=1 Tax=Entomortierella parvispora TaxID=205924 RepID=A0A9P3H9H4_9FUNG|nr:hypothetical protein EMPS_04569 [Entomortierella parvispora]